MAIHESNQDLDRSSLDYPELAQFLSEIEVKVQSFVSDFGCWIRGIFGLTRDENHVGQDHRETELEEDEAATYQCIPPHQSRHRSDFHETGHLVEDSASLYRSPSALPSCPARPAMVASRVSGGMQGSLR
ncbi:hypothetical protein LINGRAHAP2_LOCUS10601 [Linum grandiflorum]